MGRSVTGANRSTRKSVSWDVCSASAPEEFDMADNVTRTKMGLVPVNGRTRVFFGWSLFWITISTVLCSVGYLASRVFDRSTRNFAWWTAAWARMMFFFMGVRVVCEGGDRIDPSGPVVLAANHQNGLDIPLVSLALPIAFGFVAKAELARVPFLGAAIRFSPSVFVDPTEPRRTLESMRRAGAEIRSGSSVLVFPEGARSYDGKLAEFRRGAFQLALEAGVPIVPVTIVDAVCVFDERAKVARPGTIRVVVHEPVSLDGMTRRQLPEIMDRVRTAMAGPLPAAWRNPSEDLP